MTSQVDVIRADQRHPPRGFVNRQKHAPCHGHGGCQEEFQRVLIHRRPCVGITIGVVLAVEQPKQHRVAMRRPVHPIELRIEGQQHEQHLRNE